MCPWNWIPVCRALGPDVAHIEMVNILVAIRVWGNQCAHTNSVDCGNEAVVQVLSFGKTKYLTLAAIARNIQHQAGIYHFDFKVTHVPVKTNVIADFLSRWALVPNLYKD